MDSSKRGKEALKVISDREYDCVRCARVLTPNRLALVSVCNPHADDSTRMVIRLQVRDPLSFQEKNDRVKDFIVLAEVEDVGVLAEMRAVGRHGAERQLDTIVPSRLPTLNEKVDDVREHHGKCPATVNSQSGIVNQDQEAE